MTRRRGALIGLLLSLCCAIQANYVSTALHPRWEHRDESIAKEIAVLRGEEYAIDGRVTYWPEFQNRVLFAAGLRLASSLGGLSVSQWYGLLRFATAFAAFLALWGVSRRTLGASVPAAATGMFLFAFVLTLHFNHGWEHPSDFLDPIFLTAFVWAVVGRRTAALLALAAMSALNRESAVFAGLLWFCVHGLRLESWRPSRVLRGIDWRQAAVGVGAMALSYVSVIGARRAFGGARGASQLQHSSFTYWGSYLRDLAEHPAPTAWPMLLIAILLPPLLWMRENRERMTSRERGMLLAALGIFVVSAIFSILPELRMLIPLSTVLVLTALSLEARRSSDGDGLRPA